jgi:riboflavin kinase/FMN adenylyltransferase
MENNGSTAFDQIEVHQDSVCGPRRTGPSVVTVGSFDGVHLGHQEILKKLNIAAGDSAMRTVVTFEPHPQSVIKRDGQAVPVLMTAEEKTRCLCEFGVDRIYTLRFNPHLASLSAEEFVREILLRRLQAKRLVIGYNHSFGRNREGNFEFLEKNQQRFGYELEVVGPFYLEGEIISSTKIRRALESGRLDLANRYLGRPYTLEGKVVSGKGRGRMLGFPTANLEPVHPEKLIPGMGVYAVAVTVENERHPGMLSIGTRPTFHETERTIEVHLIGYSGSLYDRTIRLQFLQKLRDEIRYDDVAELIARMRVDQENSLAAYKLFQEGDLRLAALATLKSRTT